MPSKKEQLIERILTLYSVQRRTCEDATQARENRRCGCLLFQWNQAEADASVVADSLNVLAGSNIVASQGTCIATGAKVTEGARCGIGDDRFRIEMRNQLP